MVSYDTELGEWKPFQAAGAVARAGCPCGATLTLGAEGMALPVRMSLLKWGKSEMQRRQVSRRELLRYLRDEVRNHIMTEPGRTD